MSQLSLTLLISAAITAGCTDHHADAPENDLHVADDTHQTADDVDASEAPDLEDSTSEFDVADVLDTNPPEQDDLSREEICQAAGLEPWYEGTLLHGCNPDCRSPNIHIYCPTTDFEFDGLKSCACSERDQCWDPFSRVCEDHTLWYETPEQCEAGGATFATFEDGVCTDLCVALIDLALRDETCSQFAYTEGCDCGPGRCWDSGQCMTHQEWLDTHPYRVEVWPYRPNEAP